MTRGEICKALNITDIQFQVVKAKYEIKVKPCRQYDEEDFEKIKSFFAFNPPPEDYVRVSELAEKLMIGVLSVRKYAKLLGFKELKKQFSCDKSAVIRLPRACYAPLRNYILEHSAEIKRARHKDYYILHPEHAPKPKIAETNTSKEWAYKHITLLPREIIDKSYKKEWFPKLWEEEEGENEA